jgi:hypothetical protein
MCFHVYIHIYVYIIFQVSQVELGKAAKNIYNLPPPPLHVNKTIENQKTDTKNDIQESNLAVSSKAARGGVHKNLKNVPSKVVRTIKTTQNKVLMYIYMYMFTYICTCIYEYRYSCM